MTQLREWYLNGDGTYLRIYWESKEPNIIPKYVTNYVVLKEIACQTFIHQIGYTLNNTKKASWPPFLVVVGAYRFEKVKEFIEFTQNLEKYHFGQEKFKRNDWKCKVINHCAIVKYHWPIINNLSNSPRSYGGPEGSKLLA